TDARFEAHRASFLVERKKRFHVLLADRAAIRAPRKQRQNLRGARPLILTPTWTTDEDPTSAWSIANSRRVMRTVEFDAADAGRPETDAPHRKTRGRDALRSGRSLHKCPAERVCTCLRSEPCLQNRIRCAPPAPSDGLSTHGEQPDSLAVQAYFHLLACAAPRVALQPHPEDVLGIQRKVMSD